MSVSAEDFARFMVKLDMSAGKSGCWIWTGNAPSDRYGHFSVAGKAVKAHRWLYEAIIGTIPAGALLRHKCDNPPCCNPMHLEPGSSSDNRQDALSRGRIPSRQGEKHPLAKINAESVAAIRRDAACGFTQKAIALKFGISPQHVGKIVRRENWGHV